MKIARRKDVSKLFSKELPILIGDKKIFAIEYEIFENNIEKNRGVMENSWGELFFWCNNKNLFALKNNYPGRTYQWYLGYFVWYLCDNLYFLLTEGEDKFPYPIAPDQSATESLEMNRAVPDDLRVLMEAIDDDGIYNKLEKESDWASVHNLICDGDGSLIPNMSFLLRGSNIEISWDNTDWYVNRPNQEDIFFSYAKGCEYVPKEVFKEVMLEFIESFLKHFEGYFPEEVDELRKQLYARKF